ncbi:MgtC/SapB family protein [Anaeromusa sp.]|uniref:MgtC/SapB family protein n=1 Tax=Anaeromusa sp. TaxID=1872520 RepID=UPI002613EE8D|nr:MgtC/SapB family protein [Anaeromusa sp.]MDD3156786.1 MgtC/SapB family protein [Anaeromusa sp.]
MIIDDLTATLRLVLSLVLAGVIGYERSYFHKAAGLRTHILVALGSCLIMILSMNLYGGVEGKTNADPARLAAQVVSGIGFLGAGTIMKEGATIKGLTTAASLWVVACVGLAVGSGYYLGAIVTTVLSVVTLTWLYRVESHRATGPSEAVLVIHSLDKPGQIGKVASCLSSAGLTVTDMRLEKGDKGHTTFFVAIKSPDPSVTKTALKDLSLLEGITEAQLAE